MKSNIKSKPVDPGVLSRSRLVNNIKNMPTDHKPNRVLDCACVWSPRRLKWKKKKLLQQNSGCSILHSKQNDYNGTIFKKSFHMKMIKCKMVTNVWLKTEKLPVWLPILIKGPYFLSCSPSLFIILHVIIHGFTFIL